MEHSNQNDHSLWQEVGFGGVVAVATKGWLGLGYGLTVFAMLLVLMGSLAVVGKWLSPITRVAAVLLINGGMATALTILWQRLAPLGARELGIFLPLLAVNGLLLWHGCIAPVGHRHVLASGLAYALGVTVVGALRELLASGALFGVALFPLDWAPRQFAKPFGGFLLLGVLSALTQKIKAKGVAP